MSCDQSNIKFTLGVDARREAKKVFFRREHNRVGIKRMQLIMGRPTACATKLKNLQDMHCINNVHRVWDSAVGSIPLTRTGGVRRTPSRCPHWSRKERQRRISATRIHCTSETSSRRHPMAGGRLRLKHCLERGDTQSSF